MGKEYKVIRTSHDQQETLITGTFQECKDFAMRNRKVLSRQFDKEEYQLISEDGLYMLYSFDRPKWSTDTPEHNRDLIIKFRDNDLRFGFFLIDERGGKFYEKDSDEAFFTNFITGWIYQSAIT
jgi:hypothetical protein